jgi:hypothetical protein
MANRLTGAIKLYNARAAALDPAKRDKLNESLKTSFADLCEYQKLQSQAFAMGKLSYEEAQTLYRIYGGEVPSAAKWDKLSIGERVVGTKAASELMDIMSRARLVGSRRNLFRKSTVICPLCKEEIPVSVREDRTEALLKHLQSKEHNPIRHRKDGWYWGGQGPFTTRKKALEVQGAAYASGYKGRNPAVAPVILKEAGVIYSFDPGVREDPKWRSMQPYRYSWKHIPSGKKGMETVYLEGGMNAFLRLLKHWNRTEDWKYKPGPKVNPLNPRQQLYESFHGAQPQRTRKVSVPRPTSPMIAIGRATRIEYQPYGSSKHSNTRFYHDFGDTGRGMLKVRPILATDAKGKNLFLIPGSSSFPHFSNRGIIG